MSAMQLDIVTPKGPLVSTQVDEVIAPGILGEFGVLPGHVPFLTGLKPGVVRYSGKESGAFAVGAGYVETSGDKIVILADVGQRAGSVDVAQAQKDLAEAEAELARLDHTSEPPEPGVRAAVDGKRAWAQARLDAAAQAGAAAAH